ncbi:MAG TPA: hypothetical protein VMQ76_12720 [Terracidiphilus sp.]|nr:hypothetical protein [Terracidiphilus sp.]
MRSNNVSDNGSLARFSPMLVAVMCSDEFQKFEFENCAGFDGSSHPLLDALIAFLASPAGKALEAALINAILHLIPQ